jgi:putative ABC transport system permease protein
VFALLAILITVLGVFGLASYTAEQKTKEVGIRKVLGADVKQIAGMFLSLFAKIFIVASGYCHTCGIFCIVQVAAGFCL